MKFQNFKPLFILLTVLCFATPVTVIAQDLAPEPIAPTLPAQGSTLEDFIPQGWKLFDAAEFDFNSDGLTDIIAVAESPLPPGYDRYESEEEPEWFPRILFVLQNTGAGYKLSIQDEYTVRTRDEGGIWGDPYEPLTTHGDAFTVNAYGGSNWRWAEHFTYKFRNGTWVLTQAETISVFNADVRSEYIYDYEQGAGQHMEANDCGKQVTYQLKLDPPPELKVYALDLERLGLPPLTPFTVTDYLAAPGIDITGIKVPPPPAGESMSGRMLHSPDYVGYRFMTQAKEYFAVYHKKSQTVYVVAELDKTAPGYMKGAFEKVWLYNGKIYVNTVYARNLGKLKPTDIDSTKRYTAELIGVNPDGSDAATVFSHAFKTDSDYAYLALICEFGGGEVVVNVFGPNPQQYYRVNLENNTAELIGELGDCTEEELEAYQREREE